MLFEGPKHKHVKCTIYRGEGGGGNATTDSEITLLTQLQQSAALSETNAAASAAAAASSEAAAAADVASIGTSVTDAANSASAAAASASSAATSASNAATSASNASSSASAAATSESNAANSASAAATSASNAATSETNAASSASAASTSATNAANSASAASTSATNAANSASAAATSASNAASSASAAATSASNAATSESNAAASAAAAATFDPANFVEIAGDTMTGNLTVPSINSGQLAGMRNKIINGKMEIAQRATGFPAANGYNLDRWSVINTTAAVVTIDQQSDFPGNEFRTYHRTVVTTADASVDATDTYVNFQAIEGYNARDLIGRTFTLSFWVRSPKTGVHCIAFKNSGSDRSFIAEYTVNAADTWEFKSVTVNGGLITAGTWNWTNGVGLSVCFTLMNGTTRQTTANAWQTGDFYSTSAQVNVLDAINNIFAITGVQLEAGPVATPFEHRPYGLELVLCRRYFRPLEGMVGRIDTTASNAVFAGSFDVPMRAAPTVTFSGASQIHEMSVAGRDISSVLLSVLSGSGGYVRFSMTTSGTSGNLSNITGNVFAAAEL